MDESELTALYWEVAIAGAVPSVLITLAWMSLKKLFERKTGVPPGVNRVP